MERTRSAPWGIHGGGDALPNRVSLITSDGNRVAFTNGKLDSRTMHRRTVGSFGVGVGVDGFSIT
jgi:hypothetical protein